MAPPRFTNVSRGKPFSIETNESDTRYSVDLLWPYHLRRIAIDTWPDGENTTTDLPQPTDRYVIETSIDGKSWSKQQPKWVIGSEKSTRGDGPTFIAILSSSAFARFISITQVHDHQQIQIRALAEAETVQKDELQKYSMEPPTEPSEDDVKVVVVGGSNTVMRYGWSKAIAANPTKVEAAAALGASSNIFAVRTLADHPSPQAEVLLYNANVIEYPLMKSGDYDFELARDATKFVLSYCLRHNLFPINIIWPEQNYIKAAESGDQILAADSYFANLSRELAMPFVDGYSVLRALQSKLGRDYASLFRDTAHLNHFAAQLIGRAISRLLAQLKSEGLLEQKIESQQFNRSFQSVELASIPDISVKSSENLRLVSNSLITQVFVELKGNSSVSITIPNDWEVVGYLINARRCNAVISLEGSNRITKRASFKAFNLASDASPFVCVRALPYPIRPQNGSVKLSVTTASSTDYPDRLLSGAIPDDPSGLTIEIGQLILRSRTNCEKRIEVSLNDLDLTRRVIDLMDTN